MKYDWLLHLAQNAIIHPHIIVGCFGGLAQRAACHQDEAATFRLDETDLRMAAPGRHRPREA
jgi:hypothetical protein